MLPAIGRAVFLGGGLFGNALGGAIKGIGSAVGGIAQGAGSAVGGIAQGIGSAVGGAVTPAPKVIVNNVGIAGEAGKKKITGSGTLPAPKKSARPTVNANMPTEKLLVVAVNYLSSIDKTLQDQLKFESQAFNQQVQAERESSIENKKTGVFTKLSDKFGGLLKTGEDSTMKSRAGDITKVILGATGLAALGALGLAGMGDTELARLKTSWSAFTEKYAWLTDLASAVTGAGSFIGYLVGGLRGAVFGMIADWMLQRLTGSSIGNTLLGAMGIGGGTPADATAATAREPNTGFDYAMGAVVAGYGAMRGVKTYKDVTGRMSKMAAQGAAPRAAPALKGSGFRDPKTGRIVSRKAVTAGGGWLSGPKGQRFVAFLSKRFGKTYIVKKVMPLLARVFAGLAVTATGVGAIPGLLWTLLNVGLALYTVYDLLDAWWDFQDEEAASKDAAAANSAKPSTDASPATSNIGSGNIAGAPVASAEQMQNLPTIPADIEKILATIRTRESGGNYGIPHPIGMPGQTASGAYAFTNGSWQGLTKKYGIGTEYSSAYLAPPPIQDAVAAKYVEEILQKAGGDVSKVPLAWYTGNIQGKISAKALAVNNGLTPQEYQAKWMSDYTGGKYAASSYDSQGAGSSGLAAGAMDLGKGLIESVGSIISAGLGPMSGRSTSASLSSMSSTSTPRPTSSLPATPMSADTTKVSEIAQASAKIQSAIDLGNPKSNPADQMPTNSVQASLRNASSDSKLESIDPNYPGGSLDDYLKSQLYRMAA
jgi:hypothetical protein